MTKVTQAIVRCRPIAPLGAEQIILDLQGLKSCLLSLPQPSHSEDDQQQQPPAAYARYVTKSVGRLDTLLKAVMTPDRPAEDFIGHYLALVPCQSFSDFQKILDLKVRRLVFAGEERDGLIPETKGVRRSDQNHLLDLFLARTSTMPDLADSSFLSAIDLDPDPRSSSTIAAASTSTTSSTAAGTTAGHAASTATTPTIVQTGLFGSGLSFAGVAASVSREASRAPTPLGYHPTVSGPASATSLGPGPGVGAEGRDATGAQAGAAGQRGVSGPGGGLDFKRFGQRLGMGLRFGREPARDGA